MNKPTMGKWSWYNGIKTQIYDNEIHVANMIDQDGTVEEGRRASFNYAQLIVTAVNACKEINPDNPQAVAENIGEMYRELKIVSLLLSGYKSVNDNQALKNKINELLAKLEMN